RDRARDGVLGPLHAPRGTGPGLDGDAARADVRRSCPGLRAGGAPDRGGCPGQPRAARHAGGLAGERGRLPLQVVQLVAARSDPQGSRPADGRGRPRGPRSMSGCLVLEDGDVFRGSSVGAEGFAFGEAVFATAMTGYQELATDPSYSEQILCFTAPMVGNYGVAGDRSESRRAHVRGILMRE